MGPGVSDKDKELYKGIEAVVGENQIHTEQRLNSEKQNQYKYLIDIGGGGGTSVSGMLQKLAMRGVLLHHETHMRDFNYDELKPWVHYIPIKVRRCRLNTSG